MNLQQGRAERAGPRLAAVLGKRPRWKLRWYGRGQVRRSPGVLVSGSGARLGFVLYLVKLIYYLESSASQVADLVTNTVGVS